MTMTTVAVVKDYVCGCVDGNFFFFLQELNLFDDRARARITGRAID